MPRKVLTLLLMLAAAALLVAAPSQAAGPELRKLARGVFALIGEDGGTNSGFVVTGEGVVVIDSQGPRPLAELLREKIRETTPEPVVFVVNTHYHGDHTFGNQLYNEAVIAGHEKTRSSLIEKDEGHRAMFARFFGPESLKGFRLSPPDLTFSDRLTFRLGDKTIEVVYAGSRAHTDGDAFVWLPEEKVLFAGDLLYNGRLPLLNDGDTAGAVAAIDRIVATGAEVFVPGHGAVSGRQDAAVYRRYLASLRAEVRRMAGEGMALGEIRSAIALPEFASWKMYGQWLPANAEKVYMEITGEAGQVP